MAGDDLVLRLGGEARGAVEAITAASRALNQLAGSLRETGQAGQQAGQHASGLETFLGRAAATLSGFLGAQVLMRGVSEGFGLIKRAAIDMNASLETTTLQFTTLMGDSDKARAHVKDLFEFAKKTPFETGPIIAASKQLQIFGGSALNTKANLTLIGDAAAATGAPIDELGKWVGRLYANLAAGKPIGEAAQRLTELAVLGPKARSALEAVAAGGKSVEEKFKVAQQALGQFSGAMEAQANTWEGVVSTLNDSINMALAEAFKPLFEALRDSIKAIGAFAGSPEVEAFTGAVAGKMAGAVKGLVLTFQFLPKVLADFKVWSLSIAESFVGAVAAINRGMADLLRVPAMLPATLGGGPIAASLYRTAIEGAEDATRATKGFGIMLELARAQAGQASKEFAKLAAVAAGIGVAFVGPPLSAANQLGGAFDGLGTAADNAGTKIKTFLGVVQQLPGSLSFGASSLGATGRFVSGAFSPGGGTLGAAANPSNPFAGLFGSGSTGTGSIQIPYGLGFAGTTFGSGLTRVDPSLLGVTQPPSTFAGLTGAQWGDAGKNIALSLGQSISAAIQGGGKVGPAIAHALGQSLMGAFKDSESKGGQAMAGIGAGISGFMTGASVRTETGSKAKGAMMGAASGAMQGFMMGGPIGGLIGGVAGLLGGLLGGKSEGKKASEMRGAWIEELGGNEAFNQRFRDAQISGDEARALTMQLMSAKSVKEVEAAQKAIGVALERNVRLLGEQRGIESEIVSIEEQRARLAGSLVTDWAQITDIAGRYNIDLEGMGQEINQIGQTARFSQIINDFETLNRVGVDVGGMLFGMKEEISTLVNQARRMGTEMPAQMEPFIRELSRAGFLLDDNGDKITDLTGLKFGAPIKTEAEIIKDAMKVLDTTFEKLTDRLAVIIDLLANKIPAAAQTGAGAINTIQPAPVDEGADSLPGFAWGTRGLVDFGRQRVVALHGREAVLTEETYTGVLQALRTTEAISRALTADMMTVRSALPAVASAGGASDVDRFARAIADAVPQPLDGSGLNVTFNVSTVNADGFTRLVERDLMPRLLDVVRRNPGGARTRLAHLLATP